VPLARSEPVRHEDHWGLREPPFSLAPNPRFLYLSRQHHDALNALLLAVTEGRARAMLTGPTGSGKTTLIRKLEQELAIDHYRVFTVADPRRSAEGALWDLAADLRADAREWAGTDGARGALRAGLRGMVKAAIHAVVVLDEAHEVGSAELWETLLGLGDVEDDGDAAATTILVGTEELRRLSPLGPPLLETCSTVCSVGPLSRDELAEMIGFRMRTAWHSEQSVLTDAAVDDVHEFTGGLPRAACELMDNALRAGAAEQMGEIDSRLVRRVMEALRHAESWGPSA